MVQPEVPSVPLDQQGKVKRVCIRMGFSPGDTVVLTETCRALKQTFPDILFSVAATDSVDIFKGNPDVVPNVPGQSLSVRLDLNFGSPSLSRIRFADVFYRQVVGKILPNTGYTRQMPGRPFLYLTEEEAGWSPPWSNYACVCCGFKADTPVKGVPHHVLQPVVDWLTKAGITVVQVGHWKDKHFPLAGAVDMIGKTTLRELFRLVAKAQFCIGGISLLHWVSAGLGVPDICVSAGREPPTFIDTPTSLMLHTMGELECCARGGCWKWDYDRGDRGCVLPMVAPDGATVPKCMDLVGPGRIIGACQALLGVDGSWPHPERSWRGY